MLRVTVLGLFALCASGCAARYIRDGRFAQACRWDDQNPALAAALVAQTSGTFELAALSADELERRFGARPIFGSSPEFYESSADRVLEFRSSGLRTTVAPNLSVALLLHVPDTNEPQVFFVNSVGGDRAVFARFNKPDVVHHPDPLQTLWGALTLPLTLPVSVLSGRDETAFGKTTVTSPSKAEQEAWSKTAEVQAERKLEATTQASLTWNGEPTSKHYVISNRGVLYPPPKLPDSRSSYFVVRLSWQFPGDHPDHNCYVTAYGLEPIPASKTLGEALKSITGRPLDLRSLHFE